MNLRDWTGSLIPLAMTGLLMAQVPNPTQRNTATPVVVTEPMPVFRVTVVARSIKAINYHHRQGSTKVDFRGTALLPEAKGEAKVESRTGSTKIETKFDKLEPASRFGPEFLTYVMWAITPEGRAQNLGEVMINGDDAKLLATTELQVFGLIVTAEPYYAVTQPSDVVVMENFVRRDTTGTIEDVNAKYELLQRGSYTMSMAPDRVQRLRLDTRVPLDLQEARNAVAIARSTGAERYAMDTFQKAVVELNNAESFLNAGANKKRLQTVAREATQMAEDARIITLKKRTEESLANERAAAAAREASAAQREAAARAEAARQNQQRLDAEAVAARAAAEQRAEAERRRVAEAEQRAEAERRRLAEQDRARYAAQKADAERAKAEADQARMQADQARMQADQARAQADTARVDAERLRQQSEQEKIELRAQLLRQLNLILETRDSARGLIVNMSDVLFDTARYTLRPGAREKLAKVSGIVLAHPGLKLEVEGHTDSVGGEEYNQRLSEQRASAVRDYLVSQGVSSTMVTARGFGKTRPVVSNETAAGRQQNRRVEMVVSGDVIGSPVSSSMRSPVTDPRSSR